MANLIRQNWLVNMAVFVWGQSEKSNIPLNRMSMYIIYIRGQCYYLTNQTKVIEFNKVSTPPLDKTFSGDSDLFKLLDINKN